MPENLYRRNGVFYARIQVDGHDIRKSLQTKDRREAERRLKAQLANVSAYHGTVRRSFDDVMADYLLDAETTLKPRTHARYETSALMLADKFAGRWWDSVTKDAVLEYIAERKSSGAKIPTIRRDLTVLSQAAEFAIERKWGGTNPVAQIGKRQLRYKPPVFKRPSPQSEALGIACCYGNLRPLAAFLRATGMRLDEGVNLERGAVDFDRAVATLAETKNSTTRTVSLSADALAILRAQPARIGTKLFFPAIDRVTKEPRPYKQASTNWQEAQRRAEAKAAKEGWRFDRFPLHGLRHLYAIEYLARGGNLYALQRQLGHGSLRQTEWYLQFLSPEEQHGAKYESAQMASHPQRFTLAEDAENG